MARAFVSASSQFLEASSAPVTAAPLSISAWFNSPDVSVTGVLVDVTNNPGQGEFMLYLGSSHVNALTAINGSAPVAGSTTAYTTGTWGHAGGVWASASSRAAYLNGGGKGTNATTVTPAGINAVEIGRESFAATGDTYFNGSIAEVGIWNIALSDADMLALSQGLSPLLVHPEALVFYAPLLGYGAPELDLMGARGLAITGATQTMHPPMFYPKNKRARWTASPPHAIVSVSAAANGVPQAVSLSLVKAKANTLAVPANGVPQSAALALAVSRFVANVPFVTIAGVNHTTDVQFDTLRVDQRVGEEPDRCSFTTVVNPSLVPTVGMAVQIGLGNVATSSLIFGGTILTVDQVYKGVQGNVAYDITCQDYMFLLNGRRPYKTYIATNVDAIVSDMLTNFASGIALSAPSLSPISIAFDGNADFSQCVSRATALVGTHWLMDGTTLRIFSGAIAGAVPATINAANIAPTNTNGARNLKIVTDLSQIRNKIWVEGGGAIGSLSGSATVLSPGGAGGSGNVLPLNQAAGFAPSGYCVLYIPIVGTYPQVVQKFVCSFTSVNQGALVPAPTSAGGELSSAVGGNVDLGSYFYGFSYGTSAGETGMGPIASVAVGLTSPGQTQAAVSVFVTPPSDPSATKINVYRSVQTLRGGNAGSLFLAGTVTKPAYPATWPNPVVFVDTVNDVGLGGQSSIAAGAPCPQGFLPGPPGALTQLPGLNNLVSLTGTLPAIPAGTTVHVAGLFDGSAGSPYGTREYWIADNECVTPALCAVRAQAEYNLFGQPLVEATYATRDANTRAGKQVTFSLGAPTNFSNTLLIQTVTITQFGIPNQFPLYTVKAASTKFDLQDLMRRLGGFLTINGVVVAAG